MASFSNSLEIFGAIELSPNNNGFINASNLPVQNVKYPSDNGDATNKLYVDRFNHVGDIKMSVYNSDFYGWLKCDGRSLSRTTYAALFAVIGTSFGNVDGNSFNLPDCRGRVLGSIGQGSGLSQRNLGTSIGEENHTMSTTEMPSHNHVYNDAYFAEAGGNQINGHNVYGTSGTNDTDNQFRWRTSDGNWSTSPSNINTSNTGNGTPFNVMQPTLFIGNTFIYSGLEA